RQLCVSRLFPYTTLFRSLIAAVDVGARRVGREGEPPDIGDLGQILDIDALVWQLGADRGELPDEGVYVEDLTQVAYVGRLAFPAYAPRTYIHSGYQRSEERRVGKQPRHTQLA